MKCLYGIGCLIWLWVLAACSQPHEEVEETWFVVSPEMQSIRRSQLSVIDSLMWQQPDSALELLQDYFARRDVSESVSTDETFNNYYVQLLVSELLYKNDYQQTNHRELLQAVAYFDSLMADTRGVMDTRGVSIRLGLHKGASNASANNGQDIPVAFLTARAHYMNGVGYYENDSMEDACKEYMKAFEVMEDHFQEKELVGKKAQFMALTYTRLTNLFSNYYLHEQAIYFGKQSLLYYQKLPSFSWQIAWTMDEIASNYDMMEDLDSANYYYQLAEDYLNDTNSLMYRDVVAHYAYYTYKKEGVSETTLNKFHKLLYQSESKKEYLARCLTLGGIYYREQLYDSALVYLNKVYETTESVASKKQAAEWLVEICRAQGRNAEILEYAEFLVPFANLEENQSALKSQLTELYKVFVQNKLERQHAEKTRQNIKRVTILIMGLLFAMLIIVFLYHKNKKRKQGLEKQIEEEKHAHEMKQKALSGRLKKSNETLREALKRIEEYECGQEAIATRISQTHLGQEHYEDFMNAPICQEVLDRVEQLHADKRKALKTDLDISEYQSFALSTTQLASLSRTTEQYFPQLYASLKAQYPTMSQKDWKFCILYLLQLDKMSICVMLQESYHTCRRYKLKLEEVFNCQYGLTAFLLEQVDAI